MELHTHMYVCIHTHTSMPEDTRLENAVSKVGNLINKKQKTKIHQKINIHTHPYRRIRDLRMELKLAIQSLFE